MHKEPFDSYLFKQVTGVLIGVVATTALGLGSKLYNQLSKAPVCTVKFSSKNTIGYLYDWTVSVKNKDSGSLLIYPKYDLLIKLESIEKPERVVAAEDVNPSIDRKNTRGIIFRYIDGNEPIDIKFKTYSSKFLDIKNTKEAKCEDLLLDL